MSVSAREELEWNTFCGEFLGDLAKEAEWKACRLPPTECQGQEYHCHRWW